VTRSRRLCAALLLVLLALAAGAPLVACGGTAQDPFVGSWWEPASGRRVQVRAAEDGGYEVLFGSDLKAYPATESGGNLAVTHPELGALELKKAAEDRLELVSDGTASLLERAPQHQ
jgi:hypothetical protein